MSVIVRRLLPIVALFVVLAGCAYGGAGASLPASSAGVPGAGLEPVTSPDDAVDRITALEPRLTGIEPLDPDTIGQSSWYEATEVDGGYEVEVDVGWGDCIAGCIDHHRWTYLVATDGRVGLVADDGAPVPADEWPSPAGTGLTGVLGRAVAGPTCPVERPGDASCLPRPVPGAVVIVTDAAGNEVARASTDGSGRFFVELAAGTYQVAGQSVDGLMAYPEPIEVVVTAGEATVEIPYDTGIR